MEKIPKNGSFCLASQGTASVWELGVLGVRLLNFLGVALLKLQGICLFLGFGL